MRNLLGSKDQLAEIFVLGQENSVILVSQLEHHGVLDAWAILADKARIVASFAKNANDMPVHALVAEKSRPIRQWGRSHRLAEP